MGLDMYLYKKHYVKNWDWMADHEKHTISIKKGKKKLDHIKPDRVCSVVEEVMYWRKFNALHKWFVDNVQEGVDDCKESFVDESDLKMLLETLTYVLENKDTAENILPTAQGFYFGNDDMDDNYWNYVKSTIIQLKDLLEEDNKGASFYYRSSW
jgi:ribonuclease BN (tRNA processing enzyme)